jgi:hypothetical protein
MRFMRACLALLIGWAWLSLSENADRSYTSHGTEVWVRRRDWSQLRIAFLAVQESRVLKGHDFSRADGVTKMIGL